MSWIQIGALIGVAIFVLIRIDVFKYLKFSKTLKRAKKTRDPLECTLRECAPKCEVMEDFKAWKRMIDLVNKNETD